MISNNNYEKGGTRNFGRKLMFFMIGGGIGAALALLFAPKSGHELRSDIADMAEKGYDDTLAAASQLKETTAKYYKTAKETGSEVLDVVASGASAVKAEVKNDVEKIGAIVEESTKRGAASTKSANIS